MKCIGLDCEDCIQIEKRLSSNAFYAANFAGLNEALARQIVPPGTTKLLKVREDLGSLFSYLDGGRLNNYSKQCLSVLPKLN